MNDGAVVERIAHGETGFAADTPDAFAAHVVDLMTDDALFARFSSAARVRSARWSWADAARAHLSAFD